MKRRTSLALIGVMSGSLIITGFGSAAAVTANLVTETFTGPTTNSPNWVLPTASVAENNDACLSNPTAVTGQTPIPGCGGTAVTQAGLQLTTNGGDQEGGVAYTSSVPSSLGLDVTFDSYQYNGTGADGIAFFLTGSSPTDANTSPITLGPPGGSLGYAPGDQGGVGITNGYLGVGLDRFGNFTNSTFSGSGCEDPTQTAVPESLTVRGPGKGTTGYCILGTPQNAGPLDASTASDVPVEVAVNPTGSAQTAAGGFPVPAGWYAVQATPIGSSQPVTESGPLPDATGFIDSSWLGGGGIPEQLSFGWAASTGASTDYHTISNVKVNTLNGTPPALSVHLTDNSGGTAHSGQTVTYSAAASVNNAAESRQITMTDTFQSQLQPQSSGLGGAGWNCTLGGPGNQTVTCTYSGGAPIGALPPVAMPVTVSVPSGPPASVSDMVTVGSPDATQGSDTKTENYAPAPTATALAFTSQPVNAQVNAAMKNPDNTQTHVMVAAQVTPGGAVDPNYTGPITLSFANNPGNAKFLVNNTQQAAITINAAAGVADFSPIIVNAVGFGYTLQATAVGLTSATSTAFDVAAAATSCPSGQTCNVTTTGGGGTQTALITAQPGSGNAIITATYGGNVAPIHPCTGAVNGILTFSGDRPKLITLTIQTKQPIVTFCYGQPTPFLDFLYRKTTYFNQTNQDYEGLLPVCLPKYTGPCIKAASFKKNVETVTIQSGAADPHIAT